FLKCYCFCPQFRFKEKRMDEVWLVEFYAPWCGYCKKLEPVWYEVGAELKSSGSLINVGKMDATAFSSVASEFGVRGYPTIKLLKGDLAYNYKGPRTKEDIIEFANRVAGPVVRALPSRQMFEGVLNRHSVLFVYIGGDSPLKEKYIEVASEMIVYTYFFSALEDALPTNVTLQELPSVAVFKDRTYFLYDAYQDGELSSWVNRERFRGYLHIDGFTLLGDPAPCQKTSCVVYNFPLSSVKILLGVSGSVPDRDFQFGHMDGNDYINSLIMGEVPVPSIIVLNTSNDQYFLLGEPVKTLDQLVQFIHSVLDGSAQAQGGDGIFQRIKRVAFDARSTVMSVFRSSPLLGCFLFGLPLGVISLMCYGICTAESDDGTEELDLLKREALPEEDEYEDRRREGEEEEEEERQEEKSAADKKVD
uniref:protein disulfide-isomerase n=1 Tax=Scleropages formosus TaxID=113540 RepID=A0A8C9VPL3_SCLFO